MHPHLRSLFVILLAVALLVALAVILQPPGARAANPAFIPTPLAPLPTAPASAPASPAISSIDSPTPTCYQSVPYSDRCYISWGYLYVSADSGQYIISMTVNIDNRLRAYYSGFFQSSMYVPNDIYGPGLQVACGWAGASGLPNYGRAYNWTIRARQTGGLGSINSGSVYCPPNLLKYQRLPIVRK